MPGPDLHHISAAETQLSRHASLYRRGLIMMYGPIPGIACLFAFTAEMMLTQNPGTHPAFSKPSGFYIGLMVAVMLLLVLGLFAAPIGVVMRIVGSLRLAKAQAFYDLASFPEDIPLAVGDQCGRWRLIAADDHKLELAYQLAPAPFDRIILHCFESILFALSALFVVQAFRTGPASLLGLPILFAVFGWLCAESRPKWITVCPEGMPIVLLRRARIFGFIPLPLRQLALTGATSVEVFDHRLRIGPLFFDSFASGPYAEWQLRRLGHEIYTRICIAAGDGIPLPVGAGDSHE